MTKLVDHIINLLKWPVAVYMFISLPALWMSQNFFVFATSKFLALAAGFFLYFVAKTMADSSMRTAMQIIAHELTHAFFALITGHKVKKIRLDPEGAGGEMVFDSAGVGNWLIVIAPYFFPLFGFFYMLFMGFMPSYLVFNGFLGYFLGYHMDTVGSQIHEKQTDLPKVGYLFCALFLPGANLWMIGSMLAFNSKGWSGVETYFDLINHLNFLNFQKILSVLF